MKDASRMISRTCKVRKKKSLLLISLAFVHREEEINSFPSANVSAFLGFFQISRYYKPSAPFKDPNVQMVHQFH